MAPVHMILVVFFIVCEALAALWNPAPYYGRLVALGLACFGLSLLF